MSPEKLLRKARSSRLQDRQDALEHLLALSPRQRREHTLTLLADRYTGAREVGLESARSHRDTDLEDALLTRLQSGDGHAGFAQAALLLLRELPADDLRSPAYDDLITQLIDEGEPADVRYQALVAAETREHHGEPYEALLIAKLDDRDREIRSIAAQGLARLGAMHARPALLEAFRRARGDAWFHLLLTLAELGEPELIPHFERALTKAQYRFAALSALGEYGDEAAVPLLEKAAKKRFFGEPLERVAAAGSLARLGHERGVELLRDFAESRREEVAGYAAELLESL